MNLSNDELVHIASFLDDKDFLSFRNCNRRTRSLEYYPIRYYISGVNIKYQLRTNVNKCVFILLSSILSYIILISIILGISILTTNKSRDYLQDIIGYICVISTGIFTMFLILLILKSITIKRYRTYNISSTNNMVNIY